MPLVTNKSTLVVAILCLFLPLFINADVLPPHKRPFPAASIVAACIAGGIVVAGMTLAFLLALPRVLLYLRMKFVGDEEEEEDEEENQDAAQVANNSTVVVAGNSTAVNNGGNSVGAQNVELKNVSSSGLSSNTSSVVHSSAANLDN